MNLYFKISSFFILLATLQVNADCFIESPEVRKPTPFYRRQGPGKQNPDTLLQSNIVNQQKLKDGDETRIDMLPCRSNTPLEKPHAWERGQKVTLNLKCNNPHFGECEINLWKGKKTYQVLSRKACASGFKKWSLSFTIPQSFPSCQPGECFMQFYWYSAEPRDYALCADFTLAGTPTRKLRMKPGIFHKDGQDYELKDNDYNGYRGQNPNGPGRSLKCRSVLQSIVAKGENNKDKLPNQVKDNKNKAKQAIENSYKKVEDQIRSNLEKLSDEDKIKKATLFGVQPVDGKVNPERELKTTYIPGVDYCKVYKELKLQLNEVDNPEMDPFGRDADKIRNSYMIEEEI